jgi:hypothetical protein
MHTTPRSAHQELSVSEGETHVPGYFIFEEAKQWPFISGTAGFDRRSICCNSLPDFPQTYVSSIN